ncbi:MAG TPA: HAMP domain-containing sensor histidine kinase [Pyrinomonadaceae bacterium]|jgi:signal transduction histidine kinase|nr:HAMP domain-containing sensor histidine kinase [Pyrinomonadaceae bacterium]
MKSKREANTRFRLVLTLGLAVVVPALTLIYVNFQHVKSIQRGKKFEALIHRDFQYLLSNSANKINAKAYELTEQARDAFPSEADSDKEKRRKFDLLLDRSPWFAHAFFYDAKKGVIVQPHRAHTDEKELVNLDKMYSGWFSLEGPHLVEQLCKKPKPIMWYSGESDGPNGSTYTTTAIFTFPQLAKDRPVLGGVSFDPNYLKQNFFPQLLEEFTSQKLNDGSGQDSNEPEEQRLAMLVYMADTSREEPERPLATSAGWNGGKPEVSLSLDNPFHGLALGIKFQGTTAEAIAHRWVVQSFLILVVLSVLMIGGLVLTYRSVNKQVALARLKSDFVSNVSHELRTPLALIRLYAETLELGRITTQDKKNEYYSIIRKESERLSSLINNILDFSRIEAGRKEYDFRETDIAELVRNTLDSYRYQIEQQGFALEEHIDPSIPAVKVDREAIARALVNLVNNALKYSDSEKFLAVKLYREQSVLKLEVSDRGIGIERNEQARIFEKFYRTCDPLVHNTKGSGLGLSLVRHITQAHGGGVEVESTPGRGSKFTVWLPLAQST